MEKRLKKQRHRLCLRIILIMLAVWLAVSVLFCCVRVDLEKSELQKSETEKLSYSKQLLMADHGSGETVNLFFMNNPALMYDEGKTIGDYDSQYIFRDCGDQFGNADTAGGVGVKFAVSVDYDYTPIVIGVLRYDDIKNALSSEQFNEIETLLNTKRDDGNYYELVCSKLQAYSILFIPIELKIVLVNGSDPRFIIDDCAARYDLSANSIDELETYDSAPIKQNIIPKEFILGGVYNSDIIGTLTKEQRKNSVDMIRVGTFEYVFYMSDQFMIFGEEFGGSEDIPLEIRYARRIDLLKSCRGELLIGLGVIFVFFLTITFLLCFTIWKTIEEQILGEHKRQFLTNALTHDIKTPLFVISGYAYSLKEDIDETERELYIDRIIEETEEIDTIVRRMLEFGKLDQYEMTLHPTSFDLYELAKEITESLPALPDGKTLSLTHSGDSTVTADREQIKTAIENLTDNAVKYSLPESEITVTVEGGSVTVANECAPLPSDELSKLWQPFFRHDKSRSRRGSGLGLSIVRSIADMHGAKCRLEQNGTTFSCTLTLS